ncbi:hypothetical protein P171DRAFT_519941 [Karstenula rhodostoma CBS 690.94]|uniref:Uncharacterized protein n=1 Tax=Karstenula rhodostoma CBS 690.94 TaxID=1392251 RepID=A0A9P4PNC3_9PLEO|nr:hypothetical protein P171DRAFT_519941 [Karstenula rhodostoma CBS 690.94]
MNRLASRLGLSRSSKKQSFKEWSDSATVDDVHDLFTTLVKSGTDEGQSAAFSEERLEALERVLEATGTDSTGKVAIERVQAQLVKSHPSLADEVDAASSTILLLLHSHACFPFAKEVPLTKDALIRSIGLITQGSDHMFSQSAAFGQKPTIRARSKTTRMEFVFSALAHPEPPTGVPTKDDVLDVLCRIRYPHPSSFTHQQRRPITELEPLAERLLPQSSASPSRDSLRVSINELRPLANICNAMRDDKGVEAEKVLVGKESLDWNEFKLWAKAASLPAVLDELFSVLFMPPQE